MEPIVITSEEQAVELHGHSMRGIGEMMDTGVTITFHAATVVEGDVYHFETFNPRKPSPVGNPRARRAEAARRRRG